MHDQAAVRDYDTIVVDDPDSPWVDDGEVMHVQLLETGIRHRIKPKQDRLACGPEFDHMRVLPLPEKLDGTNYCTVCFTPSEIIDAINEVAKRQNEADGFIGIGATINHRKKK